MMRFAAKPAGVQARASSVVHWLVDRGHALSVVAGALHDEAARPRRPESGMAPGLRVQRCPLFEASAPHGLARTVSNVSFALASTPTLLKEAASFRPDIVAALAPSASAASAALATARIAGIPSWLHLEEDTPTLGLEGAFACVSLAALDADVRLEARGIAETERLALLPWVDTREIQPLDEPSPLRDGLGLAASDVVVLYVGHCADARVAELLIDAARQVPPRGAIRFVVCGKGPGLAAVAAAAADLPQLTLLQWPGEAGLDEGMALADIHLMPEGIAAIDPLVPAKLAAQLATGRPIVACMGTRVLPAALKGAIVPASSTGEALAAAIVPLVAVGALRHARGLASRLAAQDYFEKERVLRELERRLVALAEGRRAIPLARYERSP
jgi:colanic acid biosynthesis glycosyl transferase WcaI